MQKSVNKSSDKEVILVTSTTNGPNITNQKANLLSTFLQVYSIAIYLVVWGISFTKRHFSASVDWTSAHILGIIDSDVHTDVNSAVNSDVTYVPLRCTQL